MYISRSAKLTWCVIALIAVGAIAGAFYIVHNRGAQQRVVAATTRQPERATELFFAAPTQLPTTARAGQTIPVSFVIHNLEAQDMDYHYVVTISVDRGLTTTTVDTSVYLPNSATQIITYNVMVPSGAGKSEVSVQLINKSQAIHFWLERT